MLIRLLRPLLRVLGHDIHPRQSFHHGSWQDIAHVLRGVGRPIVLDVGANVGQTAEAILAHLPRAKLHCFEPGSEAFAQLEKALPVLDAEACAHRLALGAQPGTQQLRVNKLSVTSSLLAAAPAAGEHLGDSMDVYRVENVEVTTIARWCSQQGIDHVHLLKTDCQGFDLEVLRGAEPLLADGRINVVQCEMLFSQLYAGQACADEIMTFMRRLGFRLFEFYDPYHREDGSLRWADAVFVCSQNSDPA